MTAFAANTNVLEVDGIRSSIDNTFINTAVVTVIVTDSTGAQVSGVTWPQTMVYVAGSNGNYRVTLPNTVALLAGSTYTATITVTATAGVGTYAFSFQPQTRTTTNDSGSYNFNPGVGEIILQAYRRIGVTRPSVDREKLTDARMEMNSMFSDWANKGPNLWAVDQITIPLVAGTSTYSIDAATIDILDAYVNTGSGTQDRIITSISRSDYAAYPNKAQSGVPTVFWFDRLIAPTITVWPVPGAGSAYTLYFYRFRQTQDANTLNAQTPEVPYRWLDAVMWGLAERLAFIYAPDRLQVVGPKAQAVYAAAAAEDTENAPVRLTPDLSGYFNR